MCTLGNIDAKHVIIKLSNTTDYLADLVQGTLAHQSTPMRIFKWSLYWCPIHHKFGLFPIARMIGEPMSIDHGSATLSRPSAAKLHSLHFLKKNPN